MPKNIIIICKYASLPKEGTLTRLYYLAKYMAAAGNEVTLIRSQNNHFDKSVSISGEDLLVNGIRVINIQDFKYQGKAPIYRIISWLLFELKAILYSLKGVNKVDLVVSSSPSLFSGFSGVLISAIKKAKFVFDVRDIWPLVLIEEGGYDKKSLSIRFMSTLEKIAVKRCDILTSSIPNIQRYYATNFGKAIAKKTLFFPLCLDEEVSFGVGGERSSSHKEDFQKLIIGYAGSVGYGNNLELLAEYIEGASAPPSVEFRILGRGPLLGELERRLKRFSNVIFYKQVSREKVHEFLAGIDVAFVSCHESSLWMYGQSLNKLVEYMANGLPILMCYPSNGHRSLLVDSDGGYYCEPNVPSLTRAIEDFAQLPKSELVEMGKRNIEIIQNERCYSKIYPRMIDELMGRVS